jgi:hypothetical protein
MLSVPVIILNWATKYEKVGDILFDGQTITVSNRDSILLNTLARDPINLPDGTKVFPDQHPRLFMESLYIVYHESYVTCGRAVEA